MKLTKTQIEALASKIRRKIYEKLANEREENIEAIKATPEYEKLEELLNTRDELEGQLNELDAEINKVANLPYKRATLATIDAYINAKLPKSPTLDTIVEDITIATIDRDFDVDTFINNYVNAL